MFVSSSKKKPKSYVETLLPSVMALGDRAFGKWLRLDEVTRVEPSWMGLVPL